MALCAGLHQLQRHADRPKTSAEPNTGRKPSTTSSAETAASSATVGAVRSTCSSRCGPTPHTPAPLRGVDHCHVRDARVVPHRHAPDHDLLRLTLLLTYSCLPQTATTDLFILAVYNSESVHIEKPRIQPLARNPPRHLRQPAPAQPRRSRRAPTRRRSSRALASTRWRRRSSGRARRGWRRATGACAPWGPP